MQVKFLFPAFAAYALLGTPAVSAGPAIHIAGDSTAQSYEAKRYPQTGWGHMLGCGLKPGIHVRNHAMAGRSSRTFIEEGRLDRIRQELKRGDTLLIQFGHNDANTKRPGRYAEPQGAYRDNLIRMVEVARSAGAQPVLLTPVIRRHFLHGRVRADFTAWSNEVRRLGAQRNVPVIDLEAWSADWLQKIGEQRSKPYFLHYTPEDRVDAFPKGIQDDTHFSELGARHVADIVARELRRLKLPVSRYVLKNRPDLIRPQPLGRTACR